MKFLPASKLILPLTLTLLVQCSKAETTSVPDMLMSMIEILRNIEDVLKTETMFTREVLIKLGRKSAMLDSRNSNTNINTNSNVAKKFDEGVDLNSDEKVPLSKANRRFLWNNDNTNTNTNINSNGNWRGDVYDEEKMRHIMTNSARRNINKIESSNVINNGNDERPHRIMNRSSRRSMLNDNVNSNSNMNTNNFMRAMDNSNSNKNSNLNENNWKPRVVLLPRSRSITNHIDSSNMIQNDESSEEIGDSGDLNTINSSNAINVGSKKGKLKKAAARVFDDSDEV